MLPIVLAITGASGSAYGVRLLSVLLAAGREVHLVVSPSGQAVIEEELGVRFDLEHPDPAVLLDLKHAHLKFNEFSKKYLDTLHIHNFRNLMAPIASGSFQTSAMVICPCSGSTLAAVAHSMGQNLIHRAAEVHLKERRLLVVVPRETPLSLPQLENMKRIGEAGAVVLPAAPGLYHGAKEISDLIDFVVSRICDQLSVPNDLIRRWGSVS